LEEVGISSLQKGDQKGQAERRKYTYRDSEGDRLIKRTPRWL
jgi:hypothetical protein